MAGTAAVVKMTSLTRTANYDFYSGLLRWCLSNQAANASDPGTGSIPGVDLVCVQGFITHYLCHEQGQR